MPRRRRTSLSTQVSSAHEMEGRNHVPWEPYPLSFPAEYRHPMSLQMPARVPHPALLEKELEMQHVEVCRLLDENRRLVEDRMALQHELGAGKEELHRMSLMIADSRAQLEIRSRELTERNLKLEIDHQALQHELGSAREKLHRLNLMIADIQAQHEIRSRELTETILKLEAEHRALEPLKHLRHEVTRLSTVKQDLSSQVETLSEDIARLQGENEQIPSLRAEIDVLRQDLLRARSAAEYENKAKNELSAVKQDLSSQVGTLSKDITRLQGENEQVPSLRAEIDVLRLGLLRARSVAEYENKAKIELCAVKQDLSSQVGTLSKDIARLQGENEQIPSLRAEIDVLRQDLLCARSAAEYEKRAKIELYAVKQDLSSQVEILAKDIARLQGENEQIPSLRSEIDVLHQDLVCARSAAKYENKAKTELMDQMQIDKNGLEKPSAIQQGGIVPFHQHVQSASEKIAAFCSEILQRLDYGLVQCQVLFLAPTCERAHQIENVLRVLGSHLGVKIHACVVGSSVEEDKHTLSAGVHLVVGTPGRVLDMLRRKRQSLLPNHIKMFVLDEADEMLSRGFKDQVLGVRHAAQPNASIIG